MSLSISTGSPYRRLYDGIGEMIASRSRIVELDTAIKEKEKLMANMLKELAPSQEKLGKFAAESDKWQADYNAFFEARAAKSRAKCEYAEYMQRVEGAKLAARVRGEGMRKLPDPPPDPESIVVPDEPKPLDHSEQDAAGRDYCEATADICAICEELEKMMAERSALVRRLRVLSAEIPAVRRDLVAAIEKDAARRAEAEADRQRKIALLEAQQEEVLTRLAQLKGGGGKPGAEATAAELQ